MKVTVSGDGLKFDPIVYRIVAEEVLKDQAQKLAREARSRWPVREKTAKDQEINLESLSHPVAEW